jgi:predicted transcriptional regulator
MGEPSFTPREMDVMSILWDLGSATVAEVKERMPDPLAYTTVLSLMRTLEEKELVRHEEEGRAYRYYPLVDWRDAGQGELRRLLRKVFKGSPELLLLQLVSDRKLDEEELRRIRDLVDERLGKEEEES